MNAPFGMLMLGGTLFFSPPEAALPPVTPGAKPRAIRVHELVAWQTNLDEALALARKEKKPVFWLQIVGSLDGGL